MGSVLFVCTANICRSPMAMALFRGMAANDPDLQQGRIESAGTWAVNGQPASLLAIQTMARRGLDLSQHRSRIVTEQLLAEFNLILTMEGSHREALRVEFPRLAGRISRLSEMVGKQEDVNDPYGMTAMEYEEAATQIEEILEKGLQEVVRRAGLQVNE